MCYKKLTTHNLYELFYNNTQNCLDQTAVTFKETKLTFRDIFSVSEKLAMQLRKTGISDGSIVGLVLPNNAFFIPALLSLFRLSATVALISPKYRQSDISAINDAIKPTCYITTSSGIDVLKTMIPDNKVNQIEIDGLTDDLFLLFPFKNRTSENSASHLSLKFGLKEKDIALIKFTSGSTGTPKAIALTVENVIAEAENVVSTLEVTTNDCILSAVPLFHSYGFDLGVLPVLFAGAQMIIEDIFIPRIIIRYLSQKKVTLFLGVPNMYRFFVETKLSAIPDLSHIRYLLSCTAPLHPDLMISFYDKFGIPICQHYGSSESGAVTNHIPNEVMSRKESVGKAMKNVFIKIVDQNGNELPGGEQGEVIVKSKVIAAGYLLGEDPNKTVFKDDHYYTGDLGYIDEQGFLFLQGRKDQMINVGGLKVSPFEVIRVLNEFPLVAESAVVGAKDSFGEEFVYAAVTLKATTTENDILAFCKSHLAEYKVPRRIDIWKELPKSDSGKIILRPEDINI